MILKVHILFNNKIILIYDFFTIIINNILIPIQIRAFKYLDIK